MCNKKISWFYGFHPGHRMIGWRGEREMKTYSWMRLKITRAMEKKSFWENEKKRISLIDESENSISEIKQ